MSKVKVEVYDCELKHGNTTSTNHTIPKAGITAKEMILLKHMHGPDSLLNVKEAGHKQVDEKEELLNFARRYANTSDPLSGKRMVEKVFSVSLHNYETWIEDQLQVEEMVREERHEKSQAEMRRITVAAQAAAAAVSEMRSEA